MRGRKYYNYNEGPKRKGLQVKCVVRLKQSKKNWHFIDFKINIVKGKNKSHILGEIFLQY